MAKFSLNETYTIEENGTYMILYACTSKSGLRDDHNAVSGTFKLYKNSTELVSIKTNSGVITSWAHKSDYLIMDCVEGDVFKTAYVTNDSTGSSYVYIFKL